MAMPGPARHRKADPLREACLPDCKQDVRARRVQHTIRFSIDAEARAAARQGQPRRCLLRRIEAAIRAIERRLFLTDSAWLTLLPVAEQRVGASAVAYDEIARTRWQVSGPCSYGDAVQRLRAVRAGALCTARKTASLIDYLTGIRLSKLLRDCQNSCQN